MKQGHRIPLVYTWRDLNEPVGMIQHPMAQVDNQRDATTLGWRPKKHGDFAVGEEDDANTMMWFPVIWPWYDSILGNDGGIKLPHGTAIPLGEE